MKRHWKTIFLLLLFVLFLTISAFPQTVTTAGLEIANTFQQLNTFLLGIKLDTITLIQPGGASTYTYKLPPTAGSAGDCIVNGSTPGETDWGSCGGGGGLGSVVLSGSAVANQTIVTSSPTAATWQSTLTASEGTTGSIGGGSLANGACTSGTVSIASAVVGDKTVATPATYPGDGFEWKSYVSAGGTVTVKVCNATGGSGTPTASVYAVVDMP